MVSERGYEVGIAKEACRVLTWRRLASKPVDGRWSILDEVGARRINLVMSLPTWKQG